MTGITADYVAAEFGFASRLHLVRRQRAVNTAELRSVSLVELQIDPHSVFVGPLRYFSAHQGDVVGEKIRGRSRLDPPWAATHEMCVDCEGIAGLPH